MRVSLKSTRAGTGNQGGIVAKFKVLRPIEYSGKLYLHPTSEAPKFVKSAGNGSDIPVDASGIVDLTEEQAAWFTLGQIAPLPDSGDQQSAKKPVTGGK